MSAVLELYFIGQSGTAATIPEHAVANGSDFGGFELFNVPSFQDLMNQGQQNKVRTR